MAICYWLLRFQIYRCVQLNSVHFLLFVVVVHAGCDKQDSLMRRHLCGKLHGGPWTVAIVPCTSAVIDLIARFWPRIAILPTPPAFDAPVMRLLVGILP